MVRNYKHSRRVIMWQVGAYLVNQDGVLSLDGINTLDLAVAYGTPLFVFSEARLRYNIEAVRRAFDHPRLDTRIFYASKANSNLALLQTIRKSGINIEVNSGGELYKALRAGFKAEQIIFNG